MVAKSHLNINYITHCLTFYFIIIFGSCAASCFKHYVVILRPLKYIQTKVTITTSLVGGQTEISVVAVENV